MDKNLSIKFTNLLNDVNIKYINIVATDSGHTNYIYKYRITPTCYKYFEITTYIKGFNSDGDIFCGYQYVAHIKNNILYIVNIISDDDNDDDNKKISKAIANIDNIDISISANLDIVTNTLNNLDKKYSVKYLHFTNDDCSHTIDLSNAKTIIETLNNKLSCKKYKLSIDYIFQMKRKPEITTFSFNSEHLLLCIFTDNMCVSSIVIKYDTTENNIYIDSKTKTNYEGNKFNTLLRAVTIIITKILYTDVTTLSSQAVNPISAYIMIWYFNGQIYNNDGKEVTIPDISIDTDITKLNNQASITNLQKYIKKYIEQHHQVDVKVDLNDENIQRAQRIFDITASKIRAKGICDDSTNDMQQLAAGYLLPKHSRKKTTRSRKKYNKSIRHHKRNTKKIPKKYK